MDAKPLKPPGLIFIFLPAVEPFWGAFQEAIHQYNRYIPSFNNIYALTP